ncbi:MAG: hypothetical protein ACOC0E_10460 [Spirochaetota bacterium]
MHDTTTLSTGLLLLLLVTAVSAQAEGGREASELMSDDATIWSGERITFTKADGAAPDLAANQHRITDSVSLTRDNDGGQIYNVVERDSASKPDSPVGTLWAVGTTDDLPDLTFVPFRTAVQKPRDVVGKDRVRFIVEEQIFIDVRFTSWSREKQGGFAYERSTPAE